MKNRENIPELIEEIQKNSQVLIQIEKFLTEVKENEIKNLGKTQSTALIVAGIIENYYTCLETIFLRISEYFNNYLQANKWHSELLRKMTLQIDGVREAVISDRTYFILLELLRFRRFKRYYFELNYDWDCLDYLIKKLEQVRPMVAEDIDSFVLFLKNI